MAQSKAAALALERLKAMPWDEKAEVVAQIGLDLLVLHGAGKLTGAALSRFIALTEGLKTIAAAERIAATTGQAATPIAELGKEIAVIGKVTATYGAESATEVLQAMAQDTEFVGASGLGTTFKEKVANFFKRFEEKRNVVRQSGARSAYEQMLLDEQLADAKYEEIRNLTTDVQTITKNTNMPEFKIARIKHHIFMEDSHVLDEGIRRFHSDSKIAEAWFRLLDGSFTPNDIKLLEHEYFESKIEKIFKPKTLREAHDAICSIVDKNWKPE